MLSKHLYPSGIRMTEGEPPEALFVELKPNGTTSESRTSREWLAAAAAESFEPRWHDTYMMAFYAMYPMTESSLTIQERLGLAPEPENPSRAS